VRILDDNSPRLPYRRRQGERKTVIHWGQRKLLLSEIEFLTICKQERDRQQHQEQPTDQQEEQQPTDQPEQQQPADQPEPTDQQERRQQPTDQQEQQQPTDQQEQQQPTDQQQEEQPKPTDQQSPATTSTSTTTSTTSASSTSLSTSTPTTNQKHSRPLVVYAGAAPGTHIAMLSKLFDDHLFMLYDPAPFTVQDVPDRIITHRQLFTNDDAKRHAAQDALFICDIRAVDWQLSNDKETETQVGKDMQDQMEWHRDMDAKKSMLKFRLPWSAGITEYLDGMYQL
jgi:DNA mismatch repair ATPase MutL